MNAITKRLLSFVIVLAMVLSMAPAITLPAFAEITDTTTAEDPMEAAARNYADVADWVTTYGDQFASVSTVDDVVEDVYCPFCKENVDWTCKGAGGTIKGTEHWFLPAGEDALTGVGNLLISQVASASNSSEARCFYMNGRDVEGKACRIRARNNLNVIAIGSTITRNTTSSSNMLQLEDGGARIYGGTFIDNCESNTASMIASNSDSSDAYLELYNGTYTSNYALAAVSNTKGGNIRFYGGTLTQNAAAAAVNVTAGSVSFYGNETYPSTVENEAAVSTITLPADSTGTFTMDGNTTISGGTASSTVYMEDGSFTMNDGTISGGKGYQHNASTLRGGNLYVKGGTFTMNGGTIGVEGVPQDGIAYGGNLYATGSGTSVNLLGGTITSGKATTSGGNIMVTLRADMEIGANMTIQNGIADSNGGNLYITNGAQVTTAGTISGGESTSASGRGGNIYVNNGDASYKEPSASAKLTVTGGTISGGTLADSSDAQGGNIRVINAHLEISGGTISGGKFKANENDHDYANSANIMVSADATYTPDGAEEAENYIYDLTISGGTIGGDIRVGNHQNFVLSGTPKIQKGSASGLYLSGSSVPNVDGLQSGASIVITGEVGDVISETCTDAATAATYFTVDGTGMAVEPNTEDKLEIVESTTVNEAVFGTFDPAGCGNMAYCEACYKQNLATKSEAEAKADALVEWTEYSGAYNSSANAYTGEDHLHLYVKESVTDLAASYLRMSAGTICLNLNGNTISQDLTSSSNTDSVFWVAGGTLNIMDEKMEGQGSSVVIGRETGTASEGTALYVTAGICNLYGGTFQDALCTDDTDNSNRMVNVTGGELNMYEGTVLDGGSCASASRPTLKLASGAVFTMYDGEIIGRKMTTGTKSNENAGTLYIAGDAEATMKNGSIHGGNVKSSGGNVTVRGTFTMENGSIYGGYATQNSGNVDINGTDGEGTFTMKNGSIYNGKADTDGGNICIRNNGTFTMEDGSVYSGKAVENGGNVCLTAGTFTMEDGSVYSGEAAKNGGNVCLTAGTFNMEAGSIYGGNSTETDHDNVYAEAGTTMIMTGGTITGTTRKTALYVSGTSTKASTLVLGGDASLISSNAEPERVFELYRKYTTLVITNDWEGTAYGNFVREDNANAYVLGQTLHSGLCGTYDTQTGASATGSYTGKLYHGNNLYPVYGVDGALVLGSAKIVTKTGETWYVDGDAALEDYDIATTEGYIQIFSPGYNVANPEYNEETNPDVPKSFSQTQINGIHLTEDAYVATEGDTVNVTGEAGMTLYAIELDQEDDFDGNGTFAVADTVTINRDHKNPVTGSRFVVVDGEKIEGVVNTKAYKLDLKLSAVTLRAGQTDDTNGLYYKSRITCDDSLAAKVSNFGVVLSLIDMPGNDFLDDDGENTATNMGELSGFITEPGQEVTVNSCLLKGILKVGDPTNNPGNLRGQRKIYANAYLCIDLDGDGVLYEDGEFIMADTVNAGKTHESMTGGVAWSLYDVLYEINEKWDQYAAVEGAQDLVAGFYNHWANYGIDSWDFTSIKNHETV